MIEMFCTHNSETTAPDAHQIDHVLKEQDSKHANQFNLFQEQTDKRFV